MTITKVGVITPAQARDEARQILADRAQGKDPRIIRNRRKTQTLGEFVEHEYAPWAKVEHRSGAQTISRILSSFAVLKNKKISEITAWDIDKWRSQRLKKSIMRTTINRDIGALKAALSKAVLWGHIEVNNIVDVKLCKIDRSPRVRYLDEDEEERLLDALDQRESRIRAKRRTANIWRRDRKYAELPSLESSIYADHIRPLVLLAMSTGLRRGELFDLTWDEVDFDRRYLTVIGETGKSSDTQHVPLNELAYETLASWQNQCLDTTPFVFPARDGDRLTTIKTAWGAVLRDAKISSFRFHDLRHHFASQLVMKGVDLNTVRELMRHSDFAMTLRYAHLAPEHKAAAINALNDSRATTRNRSSA